MRFFENVKNMKKHHSFKVVLKKNVMVNGMFLLNKKNWKKIVQFSEN
jgi:hypothetical protein